MHMWRNCDWWGESPWGRLADKRVYRITFPMRGREELEVVATSRARPSFSPNC